NIIYIRLIGDKYPNYKQIIPKDNDIKAVVKRSEIFTAVKRLMVFSSKEYAKIILDFKDNNVELSIANEVNNGAENYNCSLKGELKIGFNISYLAEVFGNIEDDQVEVLM